jgi:thymidylate synthase (FAD)
MTKRLVSSELEKILGATIPVLDHGFIRVVDYMGNDQAIVDAARVSYGKGTTKVSRNKGLINYLMRHRHTTPFEMCEIKFHVKLPIFVARQWIRHRTASVNEYSARYSIMKGEFYIPDVEKISSQSSGNNQGRSDVPLPNEQSSDVIETLRNDAIQCYQHYLTMMNHDDEGKTIDETKTGVSREIARMNLTLNQYTEFYWKINLHNLLHFLSLRADSHAQYEIRVYAMKMLEIVKSWVPYTYDAYTQHVLESSTFSCKAMEVIRKMVRNEHVTQSDSGLSKREWNDVMVCLKLFENHTTPPSPQCSDNSDKM